MDALTLTVDSRNYAKWSVDKQIDEYTFNPLQCKLFNQDVFTINADTGKITLIHSPVREQLIPGVLILSGNKYGKDGNKFMYRCVPNDSKLPAFLIAYEDKHIGFSKQKIGRAHV